MCYDSGVKCAYLLREQFGKHKHKQQQQQLQQPKEDESGENPGSCSVRTKLRAGKRLLKSERGK